MTLKSILQLNDSHAKAMSELHAKGFNAPWSTSGMAGHIKRDLVLGYLDGGKIAAFIIIARAADQAEILSLMTDPDKRRSGLAIGLLMEAEAQISKAQIAQIFLEVAEDNDAAISLYRRAGYSPFGRRPGYYRRAGGRVAALNFSKRLDASTHWL